MEDIQVIAPSESHVLDQYKSLNPRTMDFSSQLPGAKTYTAIVRTGSETIRILFEPDEKMLQCFRQTAPRKVVQ